MIVKVLLEDTTDNKKLKTAHGLSLHIATNDTTILMDLGPDDAYLKNAKKLGVKINEVEHLVISHGHSDHGENIQKFFKKNNKANCYISPNAFKDLAKKKQRGFVEIGIKRPRSQKRLTYVEHNMDITPNIHLFSEVPYVKNPIGDQYLYSYENGSYIPDHFDHEIYLVVEEENNVVLFSGCSHKGIGHIIKKIENMMGKPMTHVIAGFHFSHYNSFHLAEADYIQKLGAKFFNANREYYACHCTGDEAFLDLKKEMKHKLNRIRTGSVINI